MLKSVSIFPWLTRLEFDTAGVVQNKSIKVPLVIYHALNLLLPCSINLQPSPYKNMLLLSRRIKAKTRLATLTVSGVVLNRVLASNHGPLGSSLIKTEKKQLFRSLLKINMDGS